MYTLLLILLILLLLGGGGWGYYRAEPYPWGAPVGGLGFILLVVLLVLLFSGRL